MADDIIDVKIIIDTSSLRAGSAQASAAVAASTAQIRASAMAAGVALDDVGKKATGAVPAFIRFGGGIINAQKALRDTGDAAKKSGEAVAGMHGSISTATREFRALFDELSSGRTRMTPGTLAIIGNRVLGLGPAALGAVGAVAALAGGLAYLAIKATEAARSLDSIKIGAAFAGNVGLATAQIQGLRDQLTGLGVSSGDADKVIGAFARIRDVTTPEMQALTAVVTDYASAIGAGSDKAAEALAKMFSPSERASRFIESLGGMTPALKDQAAQADASGNATAIFTAKMDALNTALQRARGAIDQQAASLSDSVGAMFAVVGAQDVGMSADQLATIRTDAQAEARKRLTAAYKESTAAIAASAAQTITAPPLATMKATAPTGAANANDAVSYWQQELATAEQYGGDVQGVMRRLNAARQEAARVAQESAQKAAHAAQEAARQEAEAARQATAAAKQAADEMTEALRQNYEVQMQIVRRSVEQQKRAIEEAQRASKEAAEQSARAWNQGFATIDRSAISVLDDMLTRQKNVGASAQEAVQKMVLSWVNGLAEIMLKLAAFEALKAASGLGGTIGGIAGAGANALGGNAGGAGSPASGLMAQLPSGIASLLSIGGSGSGGSGGAQQFVTAVQANTTATTSNTSGLSGMLSGLSGLLGGAGKLLSGGLGGLSGLFGGTSGIASLFGGGSSALGALSSLGSLFAFDSGTWSVPNTMVAQVHQGEMIVPRSMSDAVRSGAATLGAGGTGGAGATIAPNINLTVQALDNRSIVQGVANNPSVIRAIAVQVQRVLAQNPSLQGAY